MTKMPIAEAAIMPPKTAPAPVAMTSGISPKMKANNVTITARKRRLKARGGGVIVNVLGAAGERPTWGYIAGSAGNASLMAFTRGMGGTSLVDRIRIVACNPGLIRTERMETMLRASAQAKFGDAARWQELIPTHPPVGTPEQCADLVAFLASDRASHIAGTVVTIDGGAAHFSGVL